MEKNQDNAHNNAITRASAHELEQSEVIFATEYQEPPLLFESSNPKHVKDEDATEEKSQIKENSEVPATAEKNNISQEQNVKADVVQNVQANQPPKEEKEEEIKDSISVDLIFADDSPEIPEDNGEGVSSGAGDSDSDGADENPIQKKDEGEGHEVESGTSMNGIPSEVLDKMEGSMNADFSNVKINTNSQSAKDAGALAYTQGENIDFAPGQFNPSSQQGQELLGHELAHVVQQRDGRVKPTTSVNGMSVNDEEGLEAEADEMGAEAAQFKKANTSIGEPEQNHEKVHQKSNSAQFKVIQYDKEKVIPVKEGDKIISGSTKFNRIDTFYELSGKYREIKNELAEPGEDGSATAKVICGFQKKGKGIVHVDVVISITKLMPRWVDLPEIKKLANSKKEKHQSYYAKIVKTWSDYYKEVDEHEDGHISIDKRHYSDLHKLVLNKTVLQSDEIIIAQEKAGDKKQDQYHKDNGTHANLPYIQRPYEVTVDESDNDEDSVQYKLVNDSTIEHKQNGFIQSKTLQKKTISVIQKEDEPEDLNDLDPDEKISSAVKIGTSTIRSYESLADFYQFRHLTLSTLKKANSTNGIIPAPALHQTIQTGKAQQALHENGGDENITNGLVSDARDYYRTFVIHKNYGEVQKVSKARDSLIRLASDSRAKKAMLAAMQGSIRDNLKDMYRKKEEDGIAEYADLLMNVIDSGLAVHEIAGEALAKAKSIVAWANAATDDVPLPSADTLTGKLAGLLRKINTAYAAVISLKTSINIISPEGGSEAAKANNKLSSAVSLFGTLGTLVGTSATCGLWANMYLGPMTSACMSRLEKTQNKISKTTNRQAIQSKRYEDVNWNLEEGGRAMFDFMLATMSASGPSGVPSPIPGFVASYLVDNADNLNKGTRSKGDGNVLPTKGWILEELDQATAANWVFHHRQSLWAMFYGDCRVPQLKQGSELNQNEEETQTSISIPSDVNIHTNSHKAVQLKAQAFAQGKDIHFAPGQFKPNTASGQKLIGHELAHVAQQKKGNVSPTNLVNGAPINDDSALEKEADTMGEKAAMTIQKKETQSKISLLPINNTSNSKTSQFSAPRQFSGGSESSIREKIIQLAQGEIGKVKSKIDDGSGNKTGYDRLLEYFHTSAPDVWPDDVIQSVAYQGPTFDDSNTDKDGAPTSGDQGDAKFPHWCGIFAIWATKKAGKDVGNWEPGRGVLDQGKLGTTSEPKPGDIGYIDKPKQHHSIIKEVNGDTIISIDGNTGVGEVKEVSRARKTYTTFFTAFGGDAIQKKSVAEAPKEEQAQIMPGDVMQKMESSFGTSFSDVNIHKNSSQATDAGALAYAQGTDVHFAPGQFKPETQRGQELIGHELTHVVQQKEGRVQPTTQHKGMDVNNDAGLEKEADDMGRKAASGQNINKSHNDSSTIGSSAQFKLVIQKRSEADEADHRAGDLYAHFVSNATNVDDILSELRTTSTSLRDLIASTYNSKHESQYGTLRQALLREFSVSRDLVRAYALLKNPYEEGYYVEIAKAILPHSTSENLWALLSEIPSTDFGNEVRDEIYSKYNETYYDVGEPTLEADFNADLWLDDLRKACLQMDHGITDAEKIYFAVSGVGSNEKEVIDIVHKNWEAGPAKFGNLVSDWDGYVISSSKWRHPSVWKEQQDWFSGQSLKTALLDQFDKISLDGEWREREMVIAIFNAYEGIQSENGDQEEVEEAQLTAAMSMLKSSVNGLNSEPAYAYRQLRNIRGIWEARIARANAGLESNEETQAVEENWKRNREICKTICFTEFGEESPERETCRLILFSPKEEFEGGENQDSNPDNAIPSLPLNLANELHIGMVDNDETLCIQLVTKAWQQGKIDWLITELGQQVKDENGVVIRRAYERVQIVNFCVHRTGTYPYYQVQNLLSAGLSSGRSRGAARLHYELDYNDSAGQAMQAYNLLSQNNIDAALRSSTVEFFVTRYLDRYNLNLEEIPHQEGQALSPEKAFLYLIEQRYGKTQTWFDFQDLLVPTEDIDEMIRRGEERVKELGPDSALFALAAIWGAITGEAETAATLEQLQTLKNLKEISGASNEEILAIGHLMGSQDFKALINRENQEFIKKVQEVRDLKLAIGDTIATAAEIAVEAAIAILTAGMASGPLIASLSATITGILVREAMGGDDYDAISSENLQSIALAFASFGAGNISSGLVGTFVDPDSIARMSRTGIFFKEAVEGGLTQIQTTMVEAALSGKLPTTDQIIAKAVSTFGGAAGGVSSETMRRRLEASGADITGLVANIQRSMASGVTSSLTETGLNLATAENLSGEDIAIRFASSLGKSVLKSTVDGFSNFAQGRVEEGRKRSAEETLEEILDTDNASEEARRRHENIFRDGTPLDDSDFDKAFIRADRTELRTKLSSLAENDPSRTTIQSHLDANDTHLQNLISAGQIADPEEKSIRLKELEEVTAALMARTSELLERNPQHATDLEEEESDNAETTADPDEDPDTANASRIPANGSPSSTSATSTTAQKDDLDNSTNMNDLRQRINRGDFGDTDEARTIASAVLQNRRKEILRRETLDAIVQNILSKPGFEHVTYNLTTSKTPPFDHKDNGTDSLFSDMDITLVFDAPDEHLSQAIRASMEAVEQAYGDLRSRGLDPNSKLDANFYTELHEGRIQRSASASEQASIIEGQSVVSIAEMRINMDDAAWDTYKAEQFDLINEHHEPEAAERLRIHILEGEEMAATIRPPGQTQEQQERLLSQKREELNEAFINDASHSEIRTLMAEIKLLEPDAFGTRAAVEGVVNEQQVLLRRDEETGDITSSGEDFMEFEQRLPTDPGQRIAVITQEASASTGMLHGHSLIEGNTPGIVSNAAKYLYRVAHAEMLADGTTISSSFLLNYQAVKDAKSNQDPLAEASSQARIALSRLDDPPNLNEMSDQQIMDAYVIECRRLSRSITTGLRAHEMTSNVTIQLKKREEENSNVQNNEELESSATIPSTVNIHQNSSQVTDMGALAFAQGSDIHFAPGQFKPDTRAGQELIGHELGHVVQQKEGRVTPTTQMKGQSVNEDAGLEKEADDFGVAFADSLQNNTADPIQNKFERGFQLQEKTMQEKENKDSENKNSDPNLGFKAVRETLPFQLKIENASNLSNSEFPLQLNRRTVRTDADYRSYTDILALTIGEFVNYSIAQADWHASETINDSQREILRTLLRNIKNKNIQDAMGNVLVSTFKAKVDADVNTYVYAGYYRDANFDNPFNLPETDKLSNAACVITLTTALSYGNDLKKLRDGFGDMVAKRALNYNYFIDLRTKGYVDDVISYHSNTGAYFEAENGRDFDSYMLMRDEGSDPQIYHDKGILTNYIRSYHRFNVAGLNKLETNFQGGNVAKKPLCLILHTALDHNGAFHRDTNLDAVITNKNIFTILVEGATTLDSMSAQIGPLAAKFGLGGRIDQVMIAGHGNTGVTDMAGTVDRNATSTDDVVSEEGVNINRWSENQDGDWEVETMGHEEDNSVNRFMDAILDNMDLEGSTDARNSHRRILFNACLNRSNSVNAPIDSADSSAAAGQIQQQIQDNPSITEYMNQRIRNRGVATDDTGVTAIGSHGSFNSAAELVDIDGTLNLTNSEDPALSSADKWDYLEQGTNPLGVMRVALESWGEDRTRFMGIANIRKSSWPAGNSGVSNWNKQLILKGFDRIVNLYGSNGEGIRKLGNVIGDIEELTGPVHLRDFAMIRRLAGASNKDETAAILTHLKAQGLFVSAVRRLGLNQLLFASQRNTSNSAATDFLTTLANDYTCNSANPFVDIRLISALALLGSLISGGGNNDGRLKMSLLAIQKIDPIPQEARDFVTPLINTDNEFTTPANVNTALGSNQELLIRQKLGVVPMPRNEGDDDNSGPQEVDANTRLQGNHRNTLYIEPMTSEGIVSTRRAEIYRTPSIYRDAIGRKTRGDTLHIIGQSIYFYAFEHQFGRNMGTAYIRKNRVNLQ